MARFSNGNPGGPGRPKGRGNVKKILRAVEVLRGINRSPIAELVKLADETKDLRLRADIWMEINHYCEAPQKEPVRLPPETPEESVENALAAQNILKKMEDDARAGSARSD